MNIAIIGMGLSGASTLKYIIEHKNFSDNIHIDIFEKSDELGLGIAYMADDSYKLLNTQNEYNSIILEDRKDLIKWLDENFDEPPLIEGMVPRPIFGTYIRERFEKYFSHPAVSIIHEEVVNLEKSADIFKIDTKHKKYEKSYEAVFLTIGQSYYRDFYDLKGISGYIHYPFPLREKVLDLAGTDRIGIIGTGPTSVDLYRYIREYFEIKDPLYFFGQDSFFTLPYINYEPTENICTIDQSWIDKHRNANGLVSFDDFEKTVTDDFAKAKVDLRKTYEKYKENNPKLSRDALDSQDQDLAFCQKYAMDIWYVGTELYNSFRGIDRDKFYQTYFKYFDYFMAQTPSQTMENLLVDLEKDKIKIVYDTKTIDHKSDEFVVSNKKGSTYKVDKIYNATGFENDLTQAIDHDELLRNLYDSYFIEPHPSGKLINLTYPSYQPLTSINGVIDGLYLTGMWAGAVDLSNNDIRSVQISGRQVANDFMDRI